MSPAFKRPKLEKIELPDASSNSEFKILSWAGVERDFERAVEGLGLSKTERRTRLQERKTQYGRVARAARMRRDGYTYASIAGTLELSAPTISSWMTGSNLPMKISPKKAKASMRLRKQVKVGADSPYYVGYLLGHEATGMLKRGEGRVGTTKIYLHTASPEVRGEVRKALISVFGIEPRSRVNESSVKGGSHRPVRSLELSSAEASKVWTRMFGEKEYVRDFLEAHPEARLGFTRAIVDKPRVNGKGGKIKRNREMLIHHPDADTLSIVSRTLRENGVEHNLSKTRSKSIQIPKTEFTRFIDAIGFRDAKKAKRLRR